MISFNLPKDSFMAILRCSKDLWSHKEFHLSPQDLIWNDIQDQMIICGEEEVRQLALFIS